MCLLKMDAIENDVVFSSADEDNEIELTNEHDEVIGHILGKLPALENEGNVLSQPSSPTVSESNFSNFEAPPPFPSDYDRSSDSDNNADDYYETITEDESETQVHAVTVPCVNYRRDVEHPDDFGNGWLWHEADPGSSCGPFMGKNTVYLPENKRNPEDFFEALFDDTMWSKIALETNIYAREMRAKKYSM